MIIEAIAAVATAIVVGPLLFARFVVGMEHDQDEADAVREHELKMAKVEMERQRVMYNMPSEAGDAAGIWRKIGDMENEVAKVKMAGTPRPNRANAAFATFTIDTSSSRP